MINTSPMAQLECIFLDCSAVAERRDYLNFCFYCVCPCLHGQKIFNFDEGYRMMRVSTRQNRRLMQGRRSCQGPADIRIIFRAAVETFKQRTCIPNFWYLRRRCCKVISILAAAPSRRRCWHRSADSKGVVVTPHSNSPRSYIFRPWHPCLLFFICKLLIRVGVLSGISL